MLNLRSVEGVDLEAYKNILNEHPEVYIDVQNLESDLAHDKNHIDSIKDRMVEYMNFASDGCIKYFNKENLRYHLTLFEGVPESMLEYYDYKFQGMKKSLDMEKIIKPLYKAGFACELLELYMKYSSKLTKYNNTVSMLKSTTACDEYAENGHKLRKLSFEYHMQSTGRLYARNYSVQTIAVCYIKHLTVPKGRFLYWGDFGQIDLRVAWNLYLKNQETDKIYKSYSDKYEAISRILHMTLERAFSIAEFSKERDLYKKLTLERCYGAALTSLIRDCGDPGFAKTMDDFYLENKSYQKRVARLKQSISDYPRFNTVDYFGVERMIDMQQSASQKTRQALNTPIQSTSNSIMARYVIKLREKLDMLGIPHDWVVPYMLRHDEMVFSLDERMKQHLWIFEDLRHIYVDDWDVIAMEANFGKYYDVQDEELQTVFNVNLEQNRDKLVPHEISYRLKEYQPFVRFGEAEFILRKDEAGSVYVMMGSMSLEHAIYAKIEGIVVGYSEIYQMLKKMSKKMCDLLDCEKLTVYSTLLTGSTFEVGSLKITTAKDTIKTYNYINSTLNSLTVGKGNGNYNQYKKLYEIQAD